MTGVIISLLLATAVLLILVQKISMRILLSKSFKIEFDYSIVTIILKKKRKKRNELSQKKKKSSAGIPVIHLLNYIIPRSTIKLNGICVPFEFDSPYNVALKCAAVHSFVSSVLSFISANARKLEIADNAIEIYQSPTRTLYPALDFTIETKFYNFCFAIIIFIYGKSKRRRKATNVRE